MADIETFAKYLKERGAVTKLSAARDICEFNVSDKVMKLRRSGWDIDTCMVKRDHNRAYAHFIFRGIVK